jgi:hypothetical protein
MSKVRTTISLEEDVLRAVRVRAAREGCADSDVFDRALRREVGLDLLEQLWASAELDEEEAAALAQEALTATRRNSRQS